MRGKLGGRLRSDAKWTRAERREAARAKRQQRFQKRVAPFLASGEGVETIAHCYQGVGEGSVSFLLVLTDRGLTLLRTGFMGKMTVIGEYPREMPLEPALRFPWTMLWSPHRERVGRIRVGFWTYKIAWESRDDIDAILAAQSG